MLMGRSRRVTSARPATTKGCRVVQWQCGGRSALSALIFGVGPLLAASAVAINRHNLDLLCDDRQAAGHAEKLQGRQTFLCGGLNRGTTLSGQISPSYASTNRRGKCTTYRAVCGKRATLLDNADRASRKPRVRAGTEQAAGMLSGQLFGPGGNTTLEYWIDGRRIRAAWKAPQRKRPCRSRALPVDPSFFVSLS
jgi:hypothetical protein